MFITKGGAGTAAVAAGAGDHETSESDQDKDRVECGATFNGTWGSGKPDGNKYQ